MSNTFVQAANGAGTGLATSVTIVAAGGNNIIVVGVQLSGTTETLDSVTDSAGNTYTIHEGPVNNNHRYYQAWGIQTTSGATSVTANKSGTGVTARVTLCEFSATAEPHTFDVDNNGTGLAGTALSTTAFAPAATGELIVGSGGTSANRTFTAGSADFTIPAGGTTTRSFIEYDEAGLTSETCPATASSAADWGMIGGSWAEASGAKRQHMTLMGVGR